jgi:hypothetical protein
MQARPSRATGWRIGILAGCVVALTACGSKPSVDKGGFTSSQRQAAQAALGLLGKTTIPREVLALSFQTGQAPNVCSVLPRASSTALFDLFMAWNPTRPAYRNMPQSVLQAAIGVSSAKRDSYHVTTFGGQRGKPEPPEIKATLARVALTRPAEQCEVLEDGRLQISTPR